MLLKQSGIAFYLLYLSGDLESNPGPVKDPCGLCSKDSRSNQRAIRVPKSPLFDATQCDLSRFREILEKIEEKNRNSEAT